MKKAAIISLYGNSNYGNKLQNYAVQEMLKKYNYHTENIKNIPEFNNKNSKHFLKYIIFFIKAYIIKIIKKKDVLSCVDFNDPIERQNKFLNFEKRINNSKHFFSFYRLNEFTHYDCYVVGSDQVWNPNFGGLSDLDLVNFSNNKKISFSASFGVDEIPETCKEKTKRAVELFKGISVREFSGKNIIQQLLPEKQVEVLIDPTMCLTKEEWDKVIIKPEQLNTNRYILCYFLGEIREEKKLEIQNFAKKNNCEIVDIMNEESIYYSCGPSEFVYLEKNAFMICTDSFHSSVFAILYNKPFIVYEREGKRNNMGNRITTLLKKFNLEKNYYTSSKENFISCFNTNYNKVNKILEEERKKVDKFLEKNL